MSKPTAGGCLHIVGMMLSGLVAGANIMVILTLLACGLCTYITPALAPICGLFCLAYPLLVLANLLFIPVWVLLRPRYIVLPILGAALSYSFTQSYCPLHPFNSKPDGEPSCTLRVMTFNPHSFAGLEADGADTTYTLFKLLQRDTFDIICMQEGDPSAPKKPRLETAMDKLGMKLVKASNKNSGTVIYSRLPVIDADTLPMPTEGFNRSIICRLLAPNGDTVVVVNAYLESYCLKEPDKDQYRGALNSLNADSTETTGRYLIRQMRPKIKMHGPQADSLLAHITPLIEQGIPVILCGDFNDTPVSYACRRMRTILTDTYRESGSGPGFTYHEKAMPFRIDHIFVSKRFAPIRTQVERGVLESDHYPLTTILALFPKKEGATH